MRKAQGVGLSVSDRSNLRVLEHTVRACLNAIILLSLLSHKNTVEN